MTRLLAVCGPTASGKTKLAVRLAQRYGGEVVSCDSMQVYRGMDIGTAKPDGTERGGVPHHLIDVADPNESFSVADYVRLARAAIEEIDARGKLPVLAGGTGLYMNAVIDHVDFAGEKSDLRLREELRALAGEKGGEALLALLRPLDPETAARLHPNDRNRIVRAIELCRATGKTMAELNAASRAAPSPYRLCMIGLCCQNRALLYDRINKRVDRMLGQGLADEVRRLLASGADAGSTAMQAIGYKELAAYLRGEESLAEAAETIKRETRRYAKRQLTWFRREPRVRWLDIGLLSDDNLYHHACELIENGGFL